MDEEKYGPPEPPLDFSSLSTKPDVTEPEFEEIGPPPGFWLLSKLCTGTSDRENGLLQWIRKLLSW
jgi:hypothetical protein